MRVAHLAFYRVAPTRNFFIDDRDLPRDIYDEIMLTDG